jgi:DNA-binding NarL/FixJ family response regulator
LGEPELTRVLIADDQILIRAGLAAIVRATPGMEVCGEAADGEEAVALAATTAPDVVVMDIRMPNLDGIAATERILSAGATHVPRVLILTTFDLDEYVYLALRAGASAFLLKDTPPGRLLNAIDAVAGGDMLFAPSVTCRLVEHYTTDRNATPGHTPSASRRDPSAPSLPRRPRTTPELLREAQLTPKEVDVLSLVGQGLANQELATRLVVSEATIKTHVNRIMAKLHLSSRAQAVVIAYETGLVQPGATSLPPR